MPLHDAGAATADVASANEAASTRTAVTPVVSIRTRENRLIINKAPEEGRDLHADWPSIDKTPPPAGDARPRVRKWYSPAADRRIRSRRHRHDSHPPASASAVHNKRALTTVLRPITLLADGQATTARGARRAEESAGGDATA